ncbi:hypothetical protein RQP46_003199 [Phenoliferia psychrophenolica]
MRAVSLAASALLVTAATVLAQDRTTEAGEALITDPNAECTAYAIPAVTAIKSTYPTIWQHANVSFTGATAYDKALFAKMNGSIPNIKPKGTPTGDFSSVVYNATDTDCWWSWSKCTTPKIKTLPADIVTCPEPNTWGFTLDDGPNCSHNAYYDYLLSIEQKATLFYIGSNTLDWPLEAQRGLADGHEICSHTWSHPYMTAMTNEQAFAELYFSKKAIKDVLGITVKCWRPPYGDVDDRIRFIANALDMVTIGWTDDTFDWEEATIGIPSVKANYQNLLTAQTSGNFSKQGTIVLTHELNNETMSLSEDYLPAIQKQFSGGVMPIAVCMNNTQPYVETGAVYPNYVQWAAGTRTVSILAPTAVGTDVQISFTSGGAGTPTATGPAKATGTLATSTASPVAESLTALGTATQGYTGGAVSGGSAASASSSGSSSKDSAAASVEAAHALGLGSALALALAAGAALV